MLIYWGSFVVIIGLSIFLLLFNWLSYNNRREDLSNSGFILFMIAVVMICIGIVWTPDFLVVYRCTNQNDVVRSKNTVFIENDSLGIVYSDKKKYYDLPDSLLCIESIKNMNFYNRIWSEELNLKKCDE